ncbi:ParA family protein [Acidocella sp.]|uniref:ParA family protein n=1 Tax=Acidocella sp. TaxID=50710 RepID=UPI0026171DF8|nr:ParA family protein [Acidocella sp.]MDD2794648.1 ParA family protein [Acidocella sp.]
MPTIVFASSKGGVGKTTSALALAFVFTQAGAATTLIDADPNAPLARWAARFPDSIPAGLTVTGAVGNAAARAIDDAALRDPFVIVDLEGTKNVEVSVGLGRADLALIPMQGSQLDADEAASVVKLIQTQEEVFRRTIPFRVFFTRTSPVIESKGMRDIHAQLRELGIPLLRTSIMEREAFKVPFRVGASFYDQTRSDVRNPRAAIENAEAFAAEVRDILMSEGEAGQGRVEANG